MASRRKDYLDCYDSDFPQACCLATIPLGNFGSRFLSRQDVLSCRPRFRWRTQMDEQRKYAILLAATILAGRKLNEIGIKSCPARECAVSDAISTPISFSRGLTNV